MSNSVSSPPRHSAAFTVVIAMLGMFGPFSIDAVFPAFAHIGAQFGSSTAALQWITGTYLLSFGLMSLVHGPVSDAVGRKPVMLTGVLLYAAASAGAALAPNLTWLLVFRALQGVSAGAGQILSRALIRDMYEGVAAQRLMAQVSMIFAVSPALAPIIGGWLLGVGSWPVIFWFQAGFGLLMGALLIARIPETHPVERRTPLRLDVVGKGLWTVARNRSFLRLAVSGSTAFTAQFLYVTATPEFIVKMLHRGDQDFWIFFVPMITGMMLGSWVNSRLAARMTPIRIATIGFGVALIAGFANVIVSSLPGAPQLPWAVIGPSVVAGGVALAFPVLQLQQLDLFPANRGAAASVQSFITLISNALITALLVPHVTGSALQLALASAAFSVLAALVWTWHVIARRRTLAAARATSGGVVEG